MVSSPVLILCIPVSLIHILVVVYQFGIRKKKYPLPQLKANHKPRQISFKFMNGEGEGIINLYA